jgi:hypothetical protein
MMGNSSNKGIERCFAACSDCYGRIVSHLAVEPCRATRQRNYHVTTPAKMRHICDSRAVEEMDLQLLTGKQDRVTPMAPQPQPQPQLRSRSRTR